MKDPRLVIFDLDMTLIDISILDFDQILVQALDEMSVPSIPPREERKKLWFSGKEHVKLLESWGVRNINKFWKIFDDLDFKQRKFYLNKGMIHLYPDTLPVLRRLKSNESVFLSLLTNTPNKIATYQMNKLCLDHGYFDFVLALGIDGYDQSHAKPEPWGIYYIQEKLEKKIGIDLKQKTILIGDSPMDLLAAKNAMIPGIQIVRALKMEAEMAFAGIRSLDKVTLEFINSILRKFQGNCEMDGGRS
ncbi:MAG: HAD family hydrolase [Promethearchaeota archaeon]